MREVETLPAGSLEGLLEALLLVSTEAVPVSQLAQAAGESEEVVASALHKLQTSYQDANRGIQLREVAGGWRLFTHPAYYDQVSAYVVSWDRRKLSQAALETLAVVAYHQPVSRDGVRSVRGVNSDGVLASLKQKGYVKEAGKDSRQAALFVTTDRFLEAFGIRSLDDLPPLEDFAPDEESREFIRERLSARTAQVTLDEAARDMDEERELIGDEVANYEEGERAE